MVFYGEENVILFIVLLEQLFRCSSALLGQIGRMSEAGGEIWVKNERICLKHLEQSMLRIKEPW